jgi:hypothetical protein
MNSQGLSIWTPSWIGCGTNRLTFSLVFRSFSLPLAQLLCESWACVCVQNPGHAHSVTFEKNIYKYSLSRKRKDQFDVIYFSQKNTQSFRYRIHFLNPRPVGGVVFAVRFEPSFVVLSS